MSRSTGSANRPIPTVLSSPPSARVNSLETDLFDSKPRLPTSEAPSSSPIPKSSSPTLRSSPPILKSSPPTVMMNHPLPMTTMSHEHSPIATNKPGPHKRPFQYTLLPDDEIEDYKDHGDLEDFPIKRCKRLLTSFTAERTPETSIYFNQRMLELSRVSRRTFAAQMEYQRLRTEELQLIASIMEDEAEEAKARLNRVDLQIGTLRNDLFDAGVAVIGKAGSGHKEAEDISDSYSSCDDGSAYSESDHADSPHI